MAELSQNFGGLISPKRSSTDVLAGEEAGMVAEGVKALMLAVKWNRPDVADRIDVDPARGHVRRHQQPQRPLLEFAERREASPMTRSACFDAAAVAAAK